MKKNMSILQLALTNRSTLKNFQPQHHLRLRSLELVMAVQSDNHLNTSLLLITSLVTLFPGTQIGTVNPRDKDPETETEEDKQTTLKTQVDKTPRSRPTLTQRLNELHTPCVI